MLKGKHTLFVTNKPNGGELAKVIRDWAEHSADRLIDLYTRRMKQYHAAEMGKVKPLLDSKLDSSTREEVGAHAA